MISIRAFLLGVIVAGWILVNFLVLLKGYEQGSQSTTEVLDDELKKVGYLLAQQYQPSAAIKTYSTPHYAYQILHNDTIVQASSGLEDNLLTAINSGFSYANFKQYRWRTYTFFAPEKHIWVTVAEPENQRLKITENIVLSTLQPLFFGIPIAAVAIWFIIGYGLLPLKQLSQQLHDRQAHNLDAIDLGSLPKELHSVTDSVNQLLQRLRIAFQREKTFVADAAHELRTPVSNLKIHLHNLMEEEPHTLKYHHLNRTIIHLEHLVEQLLLLYRSSPELLANQSESIELEPLLQNIIAQHYHIIEEHQHDIELISEPCVFQSNRFALSTMIHNILSNAIKYTPQGGKIRVEACRYADQLVIKIEDSGPGIPPHLQQQALQRFVRLNEQNITDIDGTGLGLAIVAEAAKVVNATIDMNESTLGGLEFTITLTGVNTAPN